MSPVRYELGFYIPEDDILHSHRRENLKFYNNSPVRSGVTATPSCLINYALHYVCRNSHMSPFCPFHVRSSDLFPSGLINVELRTLYIYIYIYI
jgi:hypothetical protein